jgi:hypothetical protein
MTLTMPDYIQRANATGPITHTWNEDLFYGFNADQRLANRIRPICPLGTVALAAGFAEWVAWRFRPYFEELVLLQYVEAVWAGIIDWKYLRPRNDVAAAPDYLDDWQGAVRGPIIMTFNFLDEVIEGAKQPMTAGGSCASLGQLTEYVMPEPDLFKEWRRFAIGRLSALYPRQGDTDPGPPMPREVLDPALDYRPDMAVELMRGFLQKLDPAQNPFLRSPEEMVTEGFTGTPYTL